MDEKLPPMELKSQGFQGFQANNLLFYQVYNNHLSHLVLVYVQITFNINFNSKIYYNNFINGQFPSYIPIINTGVRHSGVGLFNIDFCSIAIK